MLGEMIQKSMLEWLQLTPELLSGRGKRAAAAAPAPQPSAEPSDVAPITAASVQPSMAMGFFTPPSTPAAELPEPWQQSMAEAYPPAGRAYSSLESGGSQRAALNEMTGYLTTRLAPSPAASISPQGSVTNPGG